MLDSVLALKLHNKIVGFMEKTSGFKFTIDHQAAVE